MSLVHNACLHYSLSHKVFTLLLNCLIVPLPWMRTASLPSLILSGLAKTFTDSMGKLHLQRKEPSSCGQVMCPCSFPDVPSPLASDLKGCTSLAAGRGVKKVLASPSPSAMILSFLTPPSRASC
uniref:cDNA FLJ33708 fis, clone BRAWH2007862 n=1 Tax=Homo sapiens TaxID=9606 RepID=Q8NBC3_HUMAN|nr:unnamed protein product [Homo sapiens]